MKADQACIVIFREKTAFRRYMICLFHVLDRLGSLNKNVKKNKKLPDKKKKTCQNICPVLQCSLDLISLSPSTGIAEPVFELR